MKNQKMTKEMYKVISALMMMGKSRITKDVAIQHGFQTAKAAKDAVDSIGEKRDTRRQYADYIMTHPGTRSDSKLLKDYAYIKTCEIIDRAGINPAHIRVNAVYGGDLNIKIYDNKIRNGYSKRCPYDMTIYEVNAVIPSGGVKLVSYDGISMIVTRKQHIGTLTRIDGLMLSRGKSYTDLKMIPCTVVTDRIGTAAHGETPKKALAAYQRKIKVLQKEARIRLEGLKLTDEITARDYMRLTGACEMGTRAFCRENGLDFSRVKMTVEKAIQMTEGYYGHNSLVSLVK